MVPAKEEKNMSRKKLLTLLSIVLSLLIPGSFQNSFGQDRPDDRSALSTLPPTGGIMPSPAEYATHHKTHFHIKNIRLNQLGLYRINTDRARKHLPLLDQTKAAPNGRSLELVNDFGATTPQISNTVQQQTMTSYLAGSARDNSTDFSTAAFFPPIGNQNPNKNCQSWATTYYQLTYEYAKSKGWTVSNGDPSKIFSPNEMFSMINGGVNVGAESYQAFAVLEANGAKTLSQYPLSKGIYAWDITPSDWQNALSARVNVVDLGPGYGASASQISQFINDIKTAINNGHVVTFQTYAYSWQTSTITGPVHNGETIITWQNGGSGGHVVTIVGYDDTITTNLGNGAIGTGAFKVANSWGSGWGNNGYVWMAYDALYAKSQVGGPYKAPTYVTSGQWKGWPNTGRFGVIWDNEVFVMTVRPNYTPKVIAQFTVNDASRDQMSLYLGLSATTASQPTKTTLPSGTYDQTPSTDGLYLPALNNDGGPKTFNGTTSTTGVNGSFVLDFTDLLPATANTPQNYYLVMNNKPQYPLTNLYTPSTTIEPEAPATLSSFQLIDLSTGATCAPGTTSPGCAPCTTVSGTLPLTASNSTVKSCVKFTYAGNVPPTAKITLDPPTQSTTGTTTLTITFDGSQSSEAFPPCNNLVTNCISTFSWDFGDGTTGQGNPVSHTFTNVTQSTKSYNVVLTVTDDLGGKNSYTFPTAITMGPMPNPPAASLTATPTSGNAPLTVNLTSTSTDNGGTITSYAWNFGDGTTGSGQNVSHTYTTASTSTTTYTVTLTITDSRGATASNHLTVQMKGVLTPPKSKVTATPTSGAHPLAVNFNGSGSTTASGQTITSYNWNFGDGTTDATTVPTDSHTFAAAGTYTAQLQVQDSRGLTSAVSSIKITAS